MYLPRRVLDIIQSNFSFFKYMYSKTVQGKYWANTCIHCNSLQGDFFTHNEPGGAFCPMSREEGKLITLYQINYKHDIPVIGGYGFDDYEFIDTTNMKIISV